MILYLMLYNRPIIINELVSFCHAVWTDTEGTAWLPFYALLDEDGKINGTIMHLPGAIHNEKALHKSVTSFFSSVTRDRLPTEEEGIAEFEIS